MATSRYFNSIIKCSKQGNILIARVTDTNVTLKRFYNVQKCTAKTGLVSLLKKHRIVVNSALITRAKSTSTGVDEILSKAASEISKDDKLTKVVSEVSSNTGIVKPELTDVTSSLNALGEESLKSLGLGKFTPPGLMQQFLELVHVNLDVPWWTSIVIVTVIIRGALFPVYLKGRQRTINSMNHAPTTQVLQEKITRARMRRDALAMQEYQAELSEYQKKHDIQTYKIFLPLLVQMPFFISMFIGLRGMATYPVESMKTGGILWFTDLTATDPYLGLPLLTSATLIAIIQIGAENPNSSPLVKKIGCGMAGAMFLFMINFPSALCCYWVTNNTISLLQAVLFSSKDVRKYLNIPEAVVHQKDLKTNNKTFRESFKEIKEQSGNLKSNEEAIRDFERLHAIEMERAGKGPVPVTYKYNPKKKRSPKEDRETLKL
ncbi:mitochondrial inner membrane protein OXA1L-like isoform X1 [Saccostrea echinata]|uniref:mitochondrial inner membrane protein OXA1L-like isoform X1 n=1 Tax=Saccostrea echinata TaxID=191078 RepID=UPI002A840C62|nr:mitochondrial inner membrane protein OXA1L-like isoform X1 [Saccostrea echinata]